MRLWVKVLISVAIATIMLLSSLHLYLRFLPILKVEGRGYWGGATKLYINMKNDGFATCSVRSIAITAEGGRVVKVQGFDVGGSTLTSGDRFLASATSAVYEVSPGVYSDWGFLQVAPGAIAKVTMVIANKSAFIAGRTYKVTVTYGLIYLLAGSSSFDRDVFIEDAGVEMPILKVYFTHHGFEPESDPGEEARRMKHALDKFAVKHSVGFIIQLGSVGLEGWGDGAGFDIFVTFNQGLQLSIEPYEGFYESFKDWMKAGGIAFAWHYAYSIDALALREVFGAYFVTDWSGGVHVIKIADPRSPFAKDVPGEFKLFEEDTMMLDPVSNPTVIVIAYDMYRVRPYFTVARYWEGWAFALQTHQGNDNPIPVETLAYNALLESLSKYRTP